MAVRSLCFAYKGSSASFQALRGVTFDVREGELFGLLGPNGGGKTTLFKILSTLLAPAEGEASIFGHETAGDPGAVRRLIGVVFQSPSLDGKLTVRENLACQGRLYGLSGSALGARVQESLESVGLAERAGESVEKLSGGLKRRAEIAKSVLHRPRLLLMDEPSTGLDPAARRQMWALVETVRRSGVTVLLTTHLMEEAEKCGRLAILHEGRLVALGSPDALKSGIGGEVVTVQAKEAAPLAGRIAERFKVKTVVVDGAVRIEKEEGNRLVPQIAQAFADEILSISVGRPTLEDVFIHKTGHRFEGGN